MAEYSAHPLWDRCPAASGDVDPAELGGGVHVLYFDDRAGVPRSLDDRRLWS